MSLVYFLTVLPVPATVFILNLPRCLRGKGLTPARTAVGASIPVLTLSLFQGLRGEACVSLLPAAFSVGCFLLLNRTAEGEDGAFPGWMALLLCVAVLLLSLWVRSSAQLARAVYGLLLCCQAAFSAYRLSLRREGIRKWVEADSVPDWAGDVQRLSLRCCVLWFSLLSCWLPSLLWTLLIGGIFALLALRNWTGRPLLARLRFETELGELSSVSTRRPLLSNGEAVSRELYERCCALMDERRPFLVDKFSLKDLARLLYTNKVYLSRSINHFSGKNFRQFVNYYRVKYAMEQFAVNKHLRVTELAMLSGFRSTVSFNMAFKLVAGETPSDWKRQHLRSARRGGRKP